MAVTDRRVRANRANAARSTGPRTKAGKAASRLNALRHGLAAAAHSEPGADQEIEALARAIVGAEAGFELLALARRVADAELSLRRSEARKRFSRIIHRLLKTSLLREEWWTVPRQAQSSR